MLIKQNCRKNVIFVTIGFNYEKRKCLHNLFLIYDQRWCNIMNCYNLVDKKGVLYKKKFLGIYKNGWDCWLNLLSKSKDLILNKTKYVNEERLKEKARNKYRSLSEEEKNKKREYGKNRYHSKTYKKNIHYIEVRHMKKNTTRQKWLNMIMSNIIFWL